MEFTLFLKVLQRKNYLVMEDIKLLAFVVLILYIAYNTDAPLFYADLFKKDLRKNYEEYKDRFPIDINFLEYINIKNNNFFSHLLACSLCTGFWLAAFLSFKVGFSLLALNVLGVWCIYYGIVKLIKYFNS